MILAEVEHMRNEVKVLRDQIKDDMNSVMDESLTEGVGIFKIYCKPIHKDSKGELPVGEWWY